MFAECVTLFVRALSAGADWFTDVFTQSGMASPWLAVIFLLLLNRFLLRPLFGSSSRAGASDTVRNNKKVK